MSYRVTLNGKQASCEWVPSVYLLRCKFRAVSHPTAVISVQGDFECPRHLVAVLPLIVQLLPP